LKSEKRESFRGGKEAIIKLGLFVQQLVKSLNLAEYFEELNFCLDFALKFLLTKLGNTLRTSENNN